MNLDLQILELINLQWTHPWADQFFLFITSVHKFWWVRYLVVPGLFFGALWKFKGRALIVFGALAVSIGVSDWVNHNVIKEAFARPRPFVSHSQIQNKLSYQPGGQSFPSSHAVNCMAAAAVLSVFAPAWTVALLVYAALVGYSRPYLGVHYPSDVVAGWILGWLWGELCIILIRRYQPAWIPNKKRTRA